MRSTESTVKSIRLLLAALLILVKVTLPYRYVAQGSLLSTELSLPDLGRHQGDADMNVIHMMETSRLHNPFPVLVTEDEFNCTFVRCHIVESLRKKDKASVIEKYQNTKHETRDR